MWRTLISATLVYGCGHPNLDGYRPGLLDRPLQSFYQQVNATARDGKRVIASIDEARLMGYLKDYIARADAQLRGASAPAQ
jgi:hypothetical protein